MRVLLCVCGFSSCSQLQHYALRRDEIKALDFWIKINTRYKADEILVVDETAKDRRMLRSDFGWGVRGKTPLRVLIVHRCTYGCAVGMDVHVVHSYRQYLCLTVQILCNLESRTTVYRAVTSTKRREIRISYKENRVRRPRRGARSRPVRSGRRPDPRRRRHGRFESSIQCVTT